MSRGWEQMTQMTSRGSLPGSAFPPTCGIGLNLEASHGKLSTMPWLKGKSIKAIKRLISVPVGKNNESIQICNELWLEHRKDFKSIHGGLPNKTYSLCLLIIFFGFVPFHLIDLKTRSFLHSIL